MTLYHRTGSILSIMGKSMVRWLASAGGILALLGPKGLCPICVAASGGILASLGLGALATERWIRWTLAVALVVGLGGLLLSARRHRRWWTPALASAGAMSVLAGRFLSLDAWLYGGMVLLVTATIGDLWARRHPWAPLVKLRLNRGA